MSSRTSHFHSLGTLLLIKEVVEHANSGALDCLLRLRRPFRCGATSLLLSEFIWRLRERSLGLFDGKKTVSEIADGAYSLTVAKFGQLPGVDCIVSQHDPSGTKVKSKEIDCRYYYRVVLDQMLSWKDSEPDVTELGEEHMVGLILQRLVVKHYYLSTQEVRRSLRPFATRYAWKVGDKTVMLWYPKEVNAKTLRAWLEKNFGNLSRASVEDKNRIQAEIDSHFGQGRWVTLDDVDSDCGTSNHGHESSSVAGLATTSILAKTVSREKVNHIESLRPSIRKLGKKILYELILRIFSDLADDTFKDQSIANDFELSKATFSRFAGSKWREKIDRRGDVTVPDLWQNTARVVSSDPDFLDSARGAGLLVNIGRALGADESEQQSET